MPVSASAEGLFKQADELLTVREVDSAIALFDKAEQLGYKAVECAAGRWMCWMFAGRFEQAWKESDFISQNNPPNADTFWNGQSWEGKHVMLRCLHGLGDTVQFIRYAPLLKQTCARLTVQTHPELVTLLQHVSGADLVMTWGPGAVEPPDWDLQMEVTELPRAFRTTLEDLPNECPYISLPSLEKCDDHGPMKVGLVWEAGPFNPQRTLPLNALSPVLSHRDCQFFALQRHVGSTDLQTYPNLYDVASHRIDVLATAKIMMDLDLIITVDTMSAHLAGALGRPVWILLPEHADWRWLLGRSDTPWYPTARLFRQEHAGDWSATIAMVAQELSQLSAHRRCRVLPAQRFGTTAARSSY